MKNIVTFLLEQMIEDTDDRLDVCTREYIEKFFHPLTDKEWDDIQHEVDSALYWNGLVAHQVSLELRKEGGDMIDKIKEYKLELICEYDVFNRVHDSLKFHRLIDSA